jgi:uncharacterized membrane protein
MATQARSAGAPQSRWVRPLIPIAIVLVVGIVFLFIGNLVAQGQGNDPIDTVRVIPFMVVGALITYGLAILAGDQDLWKFGTREVVYAAIGAALYGVLSWVTNVIPMPAVSQVTLRPAIVIPIFFGIVFGPAVGFFSGFVGNVLGDALTGFGMYPIWDIGNGLIGLVAGLSVAFPSNKKSLYTLLGIVIAFNLVVAALLFAFPDTENVLFGEGTVGAFWWVPVLIAVLVAIAGFLLRDRAELASAEVWGVLGIIVGIGFAAMADIWWNGYSFITALLGEFVPAAGSNLVNSLILLPILLTAWAAAQTRTGR